MGPVQADRDPAARFTRARAAAGALIRNSNGDILMVQPTYKDFWDLPGGYIETGEQPSSACRREVREELGLDIELGMLLVVDWAPAPREGDKILFVFDGGQLTPEQEAAIELPEDELRTWTYQPMKQIETITPARLARRIFRAAQAKSTTYLEAGYRTPASARLSLGRSIARSQLDRRILDRPLYATVRAAGGLFCCPSSAVAALLIGSLLPWEALGMFGCG